MDYALKCVETDFLSNAVNWIDENTFSLKGHLFTVDMSWVGRAESSEEKYVIVKNKTYIDSYLEQLGYPFKNIVEVGFFEGGSSVFLDLLYNPEKLVCVDRRADELLPVSNYIKNNHRADNFKMLYGFDQADTEKWNAVLDKEFPDQIDLVVDDASHQYDLTKKTFSVLFPRLKSGGVYVIEDYGWAHDSRYQDKDHTWYKNKALSNLIFELTMLSASRADIIKSIYINRGLCFIVKGGIKCETKELFDLERYLLTRDREIVHI